MRTLTAPSSSRSRLTVAWVRFRPSVARSSTNWTWLEITCSSRSRAMRCWRCGLPRAISACSLRVASGELDEDRAVGVHAVLGLRPHHGVGAVDHLVGDLDTPLGGEAVQDECVGPGGGHEIGVDLVAAEGGQAGLL